MNATPDPLDDWVEDALKTFPVAELPSGFTRRTLSRIHASGQPAPFRLFWIDYALGFFLTLLACILYAIWSSIPHRLVLQLELHWRILLSRTLQPGFLAGGMVLAVLLLAVFILVVGMSIRPRRVA